MRGDDNMEAHIRNDFILQQLLALAKVIDISDEYRRWGAAIVLHDSRIFLPFDIFVVVQAGDAEPGPQHAGKRRRHAPAGRTARVTLH